MRGDGPDELLVWYEGAGTNDRRFLATDERSSISAVTDSSGALLAINRYDEYGIPQSGNLGRFQYTGQAWLPELGMYHYKARIYSATLGRFLQTDPIGYAGGINLYAYVHNDPINWTDPLGLEEDGPIVVTGSRCPSAWTCYDTGFEYQTLARVDDSGVVSEIIVTGIRPQQRRENKRNCPTSGSTLSRIAEGAGTVGDYVDGIAIGAAGLGIATAPTGAGGAFFGGTAIVAGIVGRGAAVVQTGAYFLDGNYRAAGASALGLIGGEAVGRLTGYVTGRLMARNRMFNDLSAGQQRRADLFGNTAGAAGSRVASRAVCN